MRLAELTKIRDSLRALAAAGTQPIFDGQNALRGPAFDGENVLSGPVFGGGNASPGAIFNNVPPQNKQLLPQEGRRITTIYSEVEAMAASLILSRQRVLTLTSPGI